MFFKRQKCDICGAQYDSVEKDCPTCNAPNKAYRKGISKTVVWTPWWHQLIMIALEFLFMELISLLVAKIIVMVNPSIEKVSFVMLANSLVYLLMFLTFIGMSIPYRKKVFKSFNSGWLPYAVGFLMGIGLIVLSMIWGSIVSVFRPENTGNENQQTIVSMVSEYPLGCIIVLGFLGPICEEFSFRVGLFGLTSRINRILAYVVTALVFGFMHFSFTSEDIVNELLNIPDYIFAGVILALTYDFHGLAASTTAHVVNNVFSVIMSILLSFLN